MCLIVVCKGFNNYRLDPNLYVRRPVDLTCSRKRARRLLGESRNVRLAEGSLLRRRLTRT